MTHLSLRVDFDDAGAFGPGKAQLLELVETHGSIRSAAAAMGMSYRKAWLLLQSIEETFGSPAIVTATGGAQGGGASLTKLGRQLIAHFRRAEASAKRAASADIMAMAKLTSQRSGTRRR